MTRRARPRAGAGDLRRRVHRAELLLRAREASLVLALFIVFGLTTIKNPHFADKSSIQQLLAGASLIALLGVGQTMVDRHPQRRPVGRVGARTVRLLGRHALPQPSRHADPVAFALGLVIGAAIGAINGFITTVFRVPSLVVTLAMLYIIRGVDARIVSGKQIDPTAIPRVVPTHRVRGDRWRGPWLTVLVLVVVLVAGYGMRSLRSGRDLYAIGSNPGAAELAGVPSGRRVFTAFVISGALAGLAGALFLSQFATVNATGGTGYELNVIAAVVVGGVAIFGGSGTVYGAALGALLLNTINQALVAAKVSAFWNQAVAGTLLLLAITVDRLLALRVRAPRDHPQGSPCRLTRRRAVARLRALGDDALLRAPRGPVVRRRTRNFWTCTNAFFIGLNIGEIAIMALPLTLIVITGEIDLSIASMLGLASTLVGYLTLHGWSILPAMLVVLLVGCVGGALNGFLVTGSGSRRSPSRSAR